MATILVVDDDASIRLMMEEILSSLGYEVRCFQSANEAWHYLCAGREADLLITDVVMRGMDGRELILWIRNDPRLQTLPIILISGILNVQDVARLMDLGGVSFLGKPLRFLALQQTLHRLLPLPVSHISSEISP